MISLSCGLLLGSGPSSYDDSFIQQELNSSYSVGIDGEYSTSTNEDDNHTRNGGPNEFEHTGTSKF